MSKKVNTDKYKQIKSLIIFISVVTVLVGLGVYSHFNSESDFSKTETFFETRKNTESYYEYKDKEESAKKKAERNIYLQD